MKLKTNYLPEFSIKGTKPPKTATQATLTHGDYSQTVELTTAACNYGGCRWWFVCPHCYGQVGILYLGDSGLGCRKCYRLAYPTENKPKRSRAAISGFKVRHRLKWKGGYIGDKGQGKPPKMRWSTYEKLVARHEEYATVYWGGIGSIIARLMG